MGIAILALDFGAQLQAEAASDHGVIAAEQSEGLDMAALEQNLLDKQSALKLSGVNLQDLQARHCLLLCSALLCCHCRYDNIAAGLPRRQCLRAV